MGARERGNAQSRVGYPGKRAFDVLVALIVAVVTIPLTALLWCLVRIVMGSPVVFRQRRPGLGGELFEIFKFRTMVDKRDANGEPLPDGERLTPLGRFLRATSLDELPEIWNVIRGDMGLVGPRPLLEEYLPYYTASENLRHTVRPGITGLAQVSGRNLLSWEERLKLDVTYVENMSFVNDVRILARTVAVVLGLRGASPDSSAVGESRLDVERQARSSAPHDWGR